jgi:hypothetical protein
MRGSCVAGKGSEVLAVLSATRTAFEPSILSTVAYRLLYSAHRSLLRRAMPQCCSEVRLGDEVVATSRTATNDDNEEFPICSLIRRAAEYSASSGPALSMSHIGGCRLTRSSGACWRELHLDVELP